MEGIRRMIELGPLYHWSPRERRKSINHDGLVPGKRGINGPWYPLGPDGQEDDTLPEWRQPSISASLDPVTAWSYSHGAWRSTGTFDLWLFQLKPTDEVHVLPFWGGRLVELRIHNRIYKARLKWVGERTQQ